MFVFEAVDWVCNEIMKYAATRQRKTRILYDFSIPDIYLFWYATALFKPVKSTPPLVVAVVTNMSYVPVLVLQNTIFADAGPSKFP